MVGFVVVVIGGGGLLIGDVVMVVAAFGGAVRTSKWSVDDDDMGEPNEGDEDDDGCSKGRFDRVLTVGVDCTLFVGD